MTSPKRVRIFGKTNIKEREFEELVQECQNKDFKRGSEIRDYIREHKLSYKYKHISGHLRVFYGLCGRKYAAALEPHYYTALREALGLSKKKTKPHIREFTSYYELERAKKERLKERHRLLFEEGLIEEEVRRINAFEKAWDVIEEIFEKNQRLSGKIIYVTERGFIVEIILYDQIITAFLPKIERDPTVSFPSGAIESFKIIDICREDRTLILSHRLALKEIKIEGKLKQFESLKIGMICHGTVKKIFHYAAFIDIGYIDAILHLSQMTGSNLHHPSEILSIGMKISVEITEINKEKQYVHVKMIDI